MQTDRDLSFDAFRGVAIIAVVVIHAVAIGFLRVQPPSNVQGIYFAAAYLQMWFFAVPALVFMAGYWSSKRPVDSIQGYKAFLTRKLPRILMPYLFWSLVVLGLEAFKTRNLDVYDVMRKLLLGGACLPYYFVIVIVQLYLITPVLQYINRRSYGLALVLVLNVIALSALYFSRVYHIIGHLPAYLPFYSWVIFYAFGLWVGGNSGRVPVPQNRRLFVLPALLIAMPLSVLEGIVLLSQYDNLKFAISPLKYSSFLYSGFVILGFLAVRGNIKHWPRILVTLGNCSYGIYLVHIIILKKAIEIVQKIDVIRSSPPLYQIVLVLATLSACFVLIGLTRKLLPEVFCRRVLGF